MRKLSAQDKTFIALVICVSAAFAWALLPLSNACMSRFQTH